MTTSNISIIEFIKDGFQETERENTRENLAANVASSFNVCFTILQKQGIIGSIILNHFNPMFDFHTP